MAEPVTNGWDGIPFHKYNDRIDRDHRNFDDPSEDVEPFLSGGVGEGVGLFFRWFKINRKQEIQKCRGDAGSSSSSVAPTFIYNG